MNEIYIAGNYGYFFSFLFINKIDKRPTLMCLGTSICTYVCACECEGVTVNLRVCVCVGVGVGVRVCR